MSDHLPIVRLPWRPRKYQSPQEFNDAVDAYFAWATEKKEPITWTGLALFMGFSSRKELMAYEKYDNGMAEAAARARSLVEYAYEMRLDRDKPTGAIFALKNMGWSDRQGIDLTSSDGTMTPKSSPTIDTSKLNDDQLAALYAAISPTNEADE